MTFDELRIETSGAVTLEVTGTSYRLEDSFGSPPCSGSVVRRNTEIHSRIDAARIENEAGVTTVREASWVQTTDEGMRPIWGPRSSRAPLPPCTAYETLTFDGEASVESTLFGPGTTTLGKRGDIDRDARGEDASSASARLEADFGDGSTLAVTLTSDAGGEAQIDLVAEGVAVSFTDTYAFEAREDFPPLPPFGLADSAFAARR